MRFSLFTLGVVVAFVALFLAAAVYGSQIWLSVVSITTVVTLLAGLTAAVTHHGTGRAFWIGFSIFGWGFLLLQIMKLGDTHVLRTWALVEPVVGLIQQFSTGKQVRATFGVSILPYQLSQYGLSLIAALLGGFATQRFSAGKPRDTAGSAD